MAKRNSTVEIKDGKVVFSQEVLEYFENLRNEENSKWIDKYFKVLNDASNLGAEKYNLHHIRPCCTFKDETHKNRSQTQKLGDEFNGNIIKISVYNHLLVHYCLWKIYDDCDSKQAIQQMCGEKKYIGYLSEDELKEIAKLQEECAKENMTEEDYKEYFKNYRKENKERIKKYNDVYNEEHRDERLKKQKIWNDNHKEELSKAHKEWYIKNKDYMRIKRKLWDESHKEQKAKKQKEWESNHKVERKEKAKKRDNQLCFDPIDNNFCKLKALHTRKQRHKEKYKNINVGNCVIPFELIIYFLIYFPIICK